MKVKNRATARFAEERDGIGRRAVSRLVERAVELVGVEFAERAARAVDDNVVLPVLFDVRQVRLPPEGGRTCGRGSVAFFAGKNCVSDHLVAPVACALSRREDIYAAEHGCRRTVREEAFTIQVAALHENTRAVYGNRSSGLGVEEERKGEGEGEVCASRDLEHDAELLRVVDRHLVPERQEYVAAVPVVEQA